MIPTFTGTYCTADTQVSSVPVILHTVSVSNTDAVPTAGTIIIYDSAAESGTIIQTININAVAFAPFTLIFDRYCATGCYVGFTTTADVNVQVTTKPYR